MKSNVRQAFPATTVHRSPTRRLASSTKDGTWQYLEVAKQQSFRLALKASLLCVFLGSSRVTPPPSFDCSPVSDRLVPPRLGRLVRHEEDGGPACAGKGMMTIEDVDQRPDADA